MRHGERPSDSYVICECIHTQAFDRHCNMVLENVKEMWTEVPKTGKGRFNVTVPVPFEFLNQEKGFSIRKRKVDKMIQEKKKLTSTTTNDVIETKLRS